MFPPNIDPQTFSISACLIGAIVSPSLTAYEANSVGNWLILFGDYLLTYSSQQFLLQNRNRQSIKKDDYDTLIKTIKRIEEELAKMKN